MNRLIGLLALSLAFTSPFLSGCKGADTTMTPVCACPVGFHCDPNGACVVDAKTDGGGADAAPSTCSPACAAPTPACNASHHCVACVTDDQCPVGNVCKTIDSTSAACVPGCMDDAHCGGGTMVCCKMQCVDKARDAGNCGGCGMGCSVAHAQASCNAGKCALLKCDTGWDDCNKDPADGCETNLHADPKNCGGCGMSCGAANAINGCSDTCYIKACNFGFDDCNQDPKDGCETPVISDPKNCGACGQPCTNLPHAKSACISSTCALSACDVGFADCNNDPKDGCETPVGTDAKNCGKCGNACGQGLVCVNGGCTCQQCNIPNASSMCINNQCVFAACLQGFADCNNNTADGCEVNLNTDKNNCNKCGNVCPMNAPFCSGGTCGQGVDYGPVHTFVGVSSTHYITQGCCSVNCQNNDAVNALYFCQHFYGMNCMPVIGYKVAQTPNCTDYKMHKNGGCTSNGTDIPNKTCDTGACKIGNWNECTTGLTNLVCHCQ